MDPDVLMPVALDSAGDLLWVTAAANGLGASATCICCGAPVVAKQGDYVAWHFAHHNTEGAPSAGGGGANYQFPVGACNGETWLHRAGKRLLRRSLERALTAHAPLPLKYDTSCFHRSHEVPNALPLSATHVAEEKPLDGTRPDLTLWANERVLVFFEIVVSHAPEFQVYAQGIPVLEFRLHSQGDLWRVDSERSPTLYASRIVNQSPHKICKDNRKPCRACGQAINPQYELCYDCATHDCEECGRPTTQPGKYCSVDCAASARGMAICFCGNWHDPQYDSCYQCSGH